MVIWMCVRFGKDSDLADVEDLAGGTDLNPIIIMHDSNRLREMTLTAASVKPS